MTTITVQLNDEGLRQKAAAVPGLIDQAAAIVAVQLEDDIERDAGRHSKNGALERSIFKRRIAGGWEVGHDLQVARHAQWVHDGSRPHVIVPRKRKALRWPVPGAFAFSKKVRHPGYAGDAWIDRAARRAPALFTAAVEARLRGL